MVENCGKDLVKTILFAHIGNSNSFYKDEMSIKAMIIMSWLQGAKVKLRKKYEYGGSKSPKPKRVYSFNRGLRVHCEKYFTITYQK